MDNRDFKGIWIPKDIWLSKDLTLQEKVFLVEIDSLDNQKGCFASNGYFSEFFGISKTRVSLVIKSLIKKGYVKSKINYKEGTKEILNRVINICYRPYLIKVKDPIKQKLKDNNTLNNTITITEKGKVEIIDADDIFKEKSKNYKMYATQIFKDTGFIEAISRNQLKEPNKEIAELTTHKYLKEFLSHLNEYKHVHSNKKEFSINFSNWLRKQKIVKVYPKAETIRYS